jgi:lysophospholipase L1-like esterase
MSTPPTITAIGDSLTQGFQHGAIRRPDWSFPAMIARSLGHRIPDTHRVPDFGKIGFPIDLEQLIVDLEEDLGDSLGKLEWLLKLPNSVRKRLDYIEDYYERGPGSRPLPFDGHYHNLAAWGFTVNEALTLTSAMCAKCIAKGEGWVADDLFDVPAMPMHRAAMRVLNPGASPGRDDATMLDNLRGLAQTEPIDMLLVWLGANDCLGTVLTLEIADMPDDYVSDDPFERQAFNLTSAQQFRRDYTRLADQIADILSCNPGRKQVYVATVPYVTIPPLTRGIGNLDEKYFDSYRWFFRDDNDGKSLSRTQAQLIDSRIDQFNASIREIAATHGWTLVDTATMLEELAVGRHGASAQPGSRLRRYMESRGYQDHPLLALDPIPCVSLYTVANGPNGYRRTGGGLFSLDHVHPSTIGYALAGERFLEAMKANNPDDAIIQNARIDWEGVIRQDVLINGAPRLWDDLMTHAQRHPWLWEILVCTLARKVL